MLTWDMGQTKAASMGSLVDSTALGHYQKAAPTN